ncbi:AAA family ATPase [Candidatus Micrarchaeota archaeon]|nr:AAA family ATPase [Candidatus Micrarchaeota archaeon]
MISSLELSNWRSHGNTRLSFKKGTNLLLGIMGAGKSSVLDAVSFALFGTFPAIESRKNSVSDLVRYSEDEAEIKLGINTEGEEYVIERKIRKKGSKTSTDAYIYRDGVLLEKGSMPVNEYVEKLLSVDYELFTRAIYSEQNRIDYFLGLNPKKRKEEIDRLLGIDKFETARTNIVSVINRLKAGKKELEKDYSREEAEKTEEKIKKSDIKTARIEDSRKKELAELERKKKEIEINEKRLNEMREVKKKYDEIFENIIRNENSIKNINEELEAGKSCGKGIDEIVIELDSLSAEIKLAQIKMEEDYKRTTVLSRELGALENSHKRMAEIEKRNKELKKRIGEFGSAEEMRTELGRLKERQSLIKSEYLALESYKKDASVFIAKMDGKTECPMCGTDIGAEGFRRIKIEKEKELLETGEKLRRIGSELVELDKKIRNTENKVEKIGELKGMVSQEAESFDFEGALIEITGKKELKKKIENEIIEIKKSIEELEKNRKNIEKEKTVIERRGVLENKLEELSKKRMELEKQKNETGFDSEKYELLRREIERAGITAAEIKGKVNSYGLEIRKEAEFKEVLEKEIKKMRRIEGKIRKIEKREEQLAVFKNALLETQLEIRSGMVDSINTAMNEIWPIIYPYGDYGGIRMMVSDKDYLFEIFDSEWKELERVASGGERACAALALRVALSTVLTPNLSWLILDEPTHNLDKNSVSLLSETLQAKIPEIVDQTFIITHEEMLSGAGFTAGYRFYRDKEKKEATKVESL